MPKQSSVPLIGLGFNPQALIPGSLQTHRDHDSSLASKVTPATAAPPSNNTPRFRRDHPATGK